ncbi:MULTISPECIES: RluA family pseudouridine synthase [unclassified Vagococcus]|uniref:RluA family pseudouridine synthase n=1 Tax=unclassified Vagococcus TaxID=2648499 RepID=UPI001F512CC5|nr:MULTISPECIES: RluA family pseudouridine synthase [unclassified Vagococcus]MCI0130775.1 RluA family pseudouridine synthase [Vagococcus sp. CY53-2]UNM89165.1 RluA family pseudouridine synthase [Vagococcus sp. CY52-2]
MRFSWTVDEEKTTLKRFLNNKGVSRRLLAKIKFQGGTLLVNKQVRNTKFEVKLDDVVTIIIPDEGEHETMLPFESKLDIVYEDEHLLIVNKPTEVASIPSQYHKNGTMANYVKYYYNQQQYVNRIIHVVTRLDRDTTGLMMFAKHGFAHAMMDKQLQSGELKKYYHALVGGDLSRLKKHETIDLPIGRDETSIIKRCVIENGQRAITEYKLVEINRDIAHVAVQLHTGRTHQIRVHFSAIGCPLIGDELYGGDLTKGLNRQALHCQKLVFLHPFTREELTFELPLPNDMEELIE